MFSPYVFVNQKLIAAGEAGMPVSDLAVLRGYGVFDFFRLIDGVAPFFEEHWQRLEHSAAIMHLEMPFSKAEALQMMKVLHKNMPYPEAGLRITLTGGNSENGYLPGSEPNSLITLQPLQPLPSVISNKPFRLMTYPYIRSIADAKTIDYSMGIWLQPLLRQKGYDEALYIQNGCISECPRNNIFIVTQDGVLVTPDSGILAGITRKRVLALARTFMPVEECTVPLVELYAAREVFITSTTKGIMPVTRIDQQDIEALENSVATRLYQLLLQTS